MFKNTLITLTLASIIPFQAFATTSTQSSTHAAQNASSIYGKSFALKTRIGSGKSRQQPSRQDKKMNNLKFLDKFESKSPRKKQMRSIKMN